MGKRTIILSGGGTGGHITPLLVVAEEIKRIAPETKVVYIGEQHGKFQELTQNTAFFDEVETIYTGKFRRYHGESWLRRLTDIKTLFLNIRDAVFVVVGIVQSLWLLHKVRPDAVFLKGGFVGVPVGLVAAFYSIPFVTHDSDSVPGLANRIVGRWARVHATGMPAHYYQYPEHKVRYVGVIVSRSYEFVTAGAMRLFRETLGLPADARILLVTGGSLGAQRLNAALAHIAPSLLQTFQDLVIIHQVGKGNAGIYNEWRHDRLVVKEFLDGMFRYTGSADLVVTRAGANTLAELGRQGKACVVVPNPLLTGGHQLVNARYLIDNKAVVSIPETAIQTDSAALDWAIRRLLKDELLRQQLGKRLYDITINDAANKIAVLLLEQTA